MKSVIYTYRHSAILFAMRYLVWEAIVVIGLSIGCVYGYFESGAVVFASVLLFLFTAVPHIILVFSYAAQSRNVTISLTPFGVDIEDNGSINKVSSSDIDCVVVVTSKMVESDFDPSYLPWSAGVMYYYIVINNDGSRIVITCLLDDKHESILSHFSHLSDHVVYIRRLWPWLKQYNCNDPEKIGFARLFSDVKSK